MVSIHRGTGYLLIVGPLLITLDLAAQAVIPWRRKYGTYSTWGATGERYTTGHANGDVLFGHFWRGYNFAESAYLANPFLNRMMVFMGDPLYAPRAFQ
jgi:hypothetical protein